MANRGLIQDQAMDRSTVWVQLPARASTGRTIQALLLSLANQIRAEHMDRTVARMQIDPKTRRIIIKFKGGEE